MRFIIFTRTMWDEPPRLRKQVATMLLDHGHEVHFFQKRRFGRASSKEELSGQLTLYSGSHLVHHQLKIFPILNAIDAAYVKRIIRNQINIKSDDIVLNFCYDFFFLRDLYPNNTIIHVVNDDYISAAILPHKRSAARLLCASAEAADHNLTTSYANLQPYAPIGEQADGTATDVSLFLPWARHQYQEPAAVSKHRRREFLYWGFINDRIDQEKVLAIMDAGLKVNFVGMITQSRITDKLLGHENAIYHGIHQLGDIPHVIERCSCALMPYDRNYPYNSSLTMPNRGFELLSFGLPLLFSDLPHILTAPRGVIYRCKSADEFLVNFETATDSFIGIQPVIEDFLTKHYVESRYAMLMDRIATIETSKKENTNSERKG